MSLDSQKNKQEVGPESQNFELRASDLTNEAYFVVKPERQIFQRTNNGEIILVQGTHPKTGESYYSLPTLPDDFEASTTPVTQRVFPKYLQQNNQVYLGGEVPENIIPLYPHQIEYPLMTDADFVKAMMDGEITDARLISAFFQARLRTDGFLHDQLMTEAQGKWNKMRRSALREVYKVSEDSIGGSHKIDTDPYMNVSYTAEGIPYYENSREEVLVIACNGNLFTDQEILNPDAYITFNSEFAPAQGDIIPLLPGGMLEDFKTDKVFTDKETGQVDEEFKKLILYYRYIYGPTVATAILELMQETLYRPTIRTSFYDLGQVHAGLSTTDSTSKIIVAERVIENIKRMGKRTGDEPVEFKTEQWKVKHVLAGIKAGVITDTRIIAAFAKLYFNFRDPRSYMVAAEG